ncbi:MAG: universal stress protein [Candidatus Dormibacter sp.]
MFAKILLAVDCWPESRAAVSAASEIARALGGQVLVLHIQERHHARGVAWEPGLPGDSEELADSTVYRLARRGIPAGGILRVALVGRVPEEIANVASDECADLIILGTRGLSCLEGLFSESVGHRLIRLADQPVLIARTPRGKEFQGRRKHKHAIAHHAA